MVNIRAQLPGSQTQKKIYQYSRLGPVPDPRINKGSIPPSNGLER